MYYDPPYFLLAAGLFISITSGLAFEATLKQAVHEWAKNRSTRTLATIRGFSLVLPFLAICVGICLFLASGVQIFGFPATVAYGLSIFMTILTGGLVWWQLGKILVQLERGGSKALDLDSFI
ncbi:hypothetical protein IFO70_21615 [Phormidium tenue FACHB-886]|nr:hypothetical protein [Phormidium tenue FACHB-886]